MVDISPAVVKTVCGAKLPGPLRTATPVANGANRRHSAALSEFEPPFLNGVQRSVNRKPHPPPQRMQGRMGGLHLVSRASYSALPHIARCR
jgi:hypothetical protein